MDTFYRSGMAGFAGTVWFVEDGVYDRFRLWQQDGTLACILRRLHLTLDEGGLIDICSGPSECGKGVKKGRCLADRPCAGALTWWLDKRALLLSL